MSLQQLQLAEMSDQQAHQTQSDFRVDHVKFGDFDHFEFVDSSVFSAFVSVFVFAATAAADKVPK